jgi:nicotinate-nucleotide adenylyltransferase
VRPDASEAIHPDVQAWTSRHKVEPSAWQRPIAGAICPLDQPQLQVSSSDLRKDIAGGKNVAFLLPPAVMEYIERYGLYHL